MAALIEVIGFLLLAYFIVVGVLGGIVVALGAIGSAIGSLFHRSEKTGQTIKKSGTRQSISVSETRQPIPGSETRQFTEKGQTLTYRNTGVIYRHCWAFTELDEIETKMRACITEIAEVEGCQWVIPRDDEQLSDWETRVPKEWVELRDYVWGVLQTQISAIRRDRETQERLAIAQRDRETREETARHELWASSEDLIRRFLEIAEGKVSIVDDYGHENWDVLPVEIDRCLTKIARRRGWSAAQIQTAIKENELPQEYVWLKEKLEDEFRRYHEEQRVRPPISFDFDRMSGSEFEVWVRRLFENNGFEVQGTPATGDQGADLIAKKNGKTTVIQTKRHRSAVGNRAVQEVISAVAYYRADAGCVITNATFTPSAKALAQRSSVELIDGTKLREILRR